MTDILKIRGYAVPFGQMVPTDDAYETWEEIAPSAFDNMFSSPLSVDLRWSHHDEGAPRLASTGRATLSLFKDAYGVGFEAKMDMRDQDAVGRVQNIVCRDDPMAFASIGGFRIEQKQTKKLCGGLVGTFVTKGIFDHITITNRPVYRGTGVWPDVPLDQAPSRIWSLADRWADGREEWQRKTKAEARVVAQMRPIGLTQAGHIVMVAASGRLHVQHKATGRLIQ